MTEHNGKRAVIISNIKSSSIEQAIFILRTPPFDGGSDGAPGGIVAEAQEIINNYINKMEKNKPANRRKRRALRIAAVVLAAFCISVFAVGAVLSKL